MEEVKVGISYARSYKEIDKWKEFFRILQVEYQLPTIDVNQAVEIAKREFRYSDEYCFTRKATLGEYISLVNDGCDTLVVISRIDNINNPCNTTRYVAAQIEEYYNKQIRVIDCQISCNNQKKVLKELAYKLGIYDDVIIEKAIIGFCDIKNVAGTKKEIVKNKINLLFLGGAPFLFSFSNTNTYMTKFLTEKLNVNIIGPKNLMDLRTNDDYIYGKNRIYNRELDCEYDEDFWPRKKIMAAIKQFMPMIDGVLLVRDKYCMGKMEEVDYFSKVLQNDDVRYLVVDYSMESQTTVETLLETFVQMIELEKNERRDY